jgi:solute carrier family 25 (adenine nucleotide translocator) protein 4/5/6/31
MLLRPNSRILPAPRCFLRALLRFHHNFCGHGPDPFRVVTLPGAVSNTITFPMERVKLIITAQNANPKIKSGEVARYTGIGNCFSRVASEQGVGAFWRGNFTNCIRYFPTQAINLASKDAIKGLFPKKNPKTDFWGFFAVNLASGGAAGAFSLMFVYPLDYARTRLVSDVGSGKKMFDGLWDCLKKTTKGPKGFMSLYNGFGISMAGAWARTSQRLFHCALALPQAYCT